MALLFSVTSRAIMDCPLRGPLIWRLRHMTILVHGHLCTIKLTPHPRWPTLCARLTLTMRPNRNVPISLDCHRDRSRCARINCKPQVKVHVARKGYTAVQLSDILQPQGARKNTEADKADPFLVTQNKRPYIFTPAPQFEVGDFCNENWLRQDDWSGEVLQRAAGAYASDSMDPPGISCRQRRDSLCRMVMRS